MQERRSGWKIRLQLVNQFYAGKRLGHTMGQQSTAKLLCAQMPGVHPGRRAAGTNWGGWSEDEEDKPPEWDGKIYFEDEYDKETFFFGAWKF